MHKQLKYIFLPRIVPTRNGCISNITNLPFSFIADNSKREDYTETAISPPRKYIQL